ncbi:MAG: hypothetical protein HYS22_09110 [Deltaproteobacteria bacterium]|nr:hypothetical protein [Deltaproteobacteria bacterium]
MVTDKLTSLARGSLRKTPLSPWWERVGVRVTMDGKRFGFFSRFLLISLVLTLLFPPTLFAGPAIPAESAKLATLIQEARNHYYQMEWTQARVKGEKAMALVSSMKLEGAVREQFIEASLLMAMIDLADGRRRSAVTGLEKVVQLDPNYRPDPKLYPPRMIKTYEEARTNTMIDQARDQHPAPVPPPLALRTTERKPFYKKPIFWIASGVLMAGLGAGIGFAVAGGGGGGGGAIDLAIPPLGVNK